jgi:hypothetical protein
MPQPPVQKPLQLIIFGIVLFVCTALSFLAGLNLGSAGGGQTSLDAASIAPPPVVVNTRENPHPTGSWVYIGEDRWLSIVQVVRPADGIAQENSRYQVDPDPSREYMLVTVQVHCRKPLFAKCIFAALDLHAAGEGAARFERAVADGLENELEPVSDFYSGTRLTGAILFWVPKEDQSILIVYETASEDSIYFAVR